ncbi:chaplin [Streptomyces sp. NPDC048248]|uniref:chaplin n=1 Tax=Streptomyces sp. NPDC048248 TaxID=3365523 RepID=UPI003720EF80
MKRFAKTASAAAVTCAMVIGGAGVASATNGGHHHHKGGKGGATAKARASHSPGFLSGNVVQVPVHIPINVCGNTVNILALLNPAFGNSCVNK